MNTYIVIEEKNRLEQEAREKEQRERQEREAREAFDLPKIAEENNRSGELEKDSSLSSSSKQSKNIYKDSIIGLILSGRYQVVKKIGSGAFGLVYLVNDIKIDIKKYKGKAMKIMDQLDSATENELMIFSEISHENIVRYFDHFHRSIKGEGNQTFLITEYCENGDLRNKIEETKRQKRNFDQIQILDWIFQATNALKYLHSRKPDPIIHRDIKPANMLLTERNEIKLADLGISKIMEETHTSTFTGTLVYMSPEVSQAFFMDIKYYPNTDIWSLGCVLYELIFLKKAFPEGQRRNPPIPSNVSSSGIFLKILPKMLEKDCLVRITSRQLFTELENLSNSVNKY